MKRTRCCGNPLFEDEFPDAASALMDMCSCNQQARQRGKRNKSFDLTPAIQVRSDKVGRNEPCPCNSGMKFKKCCA